MAVKNWYEFFTKNNGETIAYLKGKENSLYYNKITEKKFDSQSLFNNAQNLEYRLTKEGSPKGYFKYKTHAEKFNQEILKGKGEISPNKKYKKF